jgi:hypothetical protein
MHASYQSKQGTQEMEGKNEVSKITPELVKDVSFSDKVAEVETALKSRAAAQKEIKTKWAGVVQVLAKYEVTPPRRRTDAADAAARVENITVYKPKPEVAEGLRAIIESDADYCLKNLASSPSLRLVTAKVRGLRSFLDDFMETREILRQNPEKDEAKTTEARAEYQKAVDAYIEALESYDETLDGVSNVTEYIGIVKDIAGISAIARGTSQ